MLWSNNLNEDYITTYNVLMHSYITHNLENKKMVFYIIDYYELQLHV